MKENKKPPFWHKIAVPFLGMLIAYVKFIGWLIELPTNRLLAMGSVFMLICLAVIHFNGVPLW